MNVTDHIRARILSRAGIKVNDETLKCSLSPDEILDEEMDWGFLSEMSYGIIMGYLRYGPSSKSSISNLKEAKRRIQRYETTGNQECLRDAANYLMRERRIPSIKNTHYTPTDDGTHSR